LGEPLVEPLGTLLSCLSNQNLELGDVVYYLTISLFGKNCSRENENELTKGGAVV